MRKFSFFLLPLLCLCASTAWGQISWIGETIVASSNFYIQHQNTGKFLQDNNTVVDMNLNNPPCTWIPSTSTNGFTFASSTGKRIKIYNSVGGDKFTTNESSGATDNYCTQTNGVYDIYVGRTSWGDQWWLHASCDNNSSLKVYAEKKGSATILPNDNTKWLFISTLQFNNHKVLVAYDAANTTAGGYDEDDYPEATWEQIQNYSQGTTGYLTYSNYSTWITNSSTSPTMVSSINAATTYLTTTAPAIAEAYADALEYLSAARDTLAFGLDGNGDPYDSDIYNTYSAAITTAEGDVQDATTVAAITLAISTLKTATQTFLNDSREVVADLINTHAEQAEDLSVQFTTLVNYVATAQDAINDDEKTATDLLEIDATLLDYIDVATDLISSDEYSSYSSKLSGANALADANEVNTYFDNTLNTAISTAESDLLDARLSSLANGKADISTINGNIDAAVSAYNVAITSKNSYLTKRAAALDLADDIAAATGINGVLTDAVDAQDAIVAAATTSSTIDGAVSPLESAIAIYNAALPRYKYAMQQVDVAERSGYDASDDEDDINAATSASAINTLISTLRTSAKEYIVENATAGMDVTIFIENNSFESGTTEGWSTSMQTGKDNGDTGAKSTSNETYEAEGSDGDFLFNTWAQRDYPINNKKFEGATLTQALSGLPNGYYRFTVSLTSDEGVKVYMKVGDAEVYITSSNKAVFNQTSTIVQVTNGTVTLQTYGESDSYYHAGDVKTYNYKKWYKADNFTLQFLGAHPYQSYAFNIVQSADDLEGFDNSSYKNTINNNPTDDDLISETLSRFRTNAFNHVRSNSIVGQDITFLLENSDFEYLLEWDYGWSGTTEALNDGKDTQMEAYQHTTLSSSCAWMYQEGRFAINQKVLNPGNIYQRLSLPAGTYKVEAQIIANQSSVYSTFYVKEVLGDESENTLASVTVNNFNGIKELVFTLSSNATIKIGVSHTEVDDKQKDRYSAVDNFKLYYWETAKQKDLVDGYAMLYSSNKNIRIDDTDAKVYSATWNNDSDNPVVTLHEDPFGGASERIIEAGKVVLIYNSTKPAKLNYSHTATTATDEISDNLFVHHDGEATSYTNYVLGKQGDVVAFHRFTGDESDLENYNVLQLPISPTLAPSAVRIVTEGNTATALMPVYEENSAAAGQKANSKKIFIDGHLYIQQGNTLYDALGRKVQ